MSGRALAVLALLAFPGSGALSAQTPADLLAHGIRPYQQLELDRAAELLRRSLLESGSPLTPDDVSRALSYLAATEFFRGRLDSARAAFRQLVHHDPRYRVDEVTFPPEITSLFAAVRRATVPLETRLATARLAAAPDTAPARLPVRSPRPVSRAAREIDLHSAARFSGGGTLARARVRSTVGATEQTTSGTTLGIEGGLTFGRVRVDGGYVEGRLGPRDVIEGRLFAGVVPVPGVLVRVGPQARAYVTGDGRERWLFWQARVRGERTLVGPVLRGYVELWRSLSGDVSVSEPFDHAAGGEAGMIFVRPAGLPFWGRLTYGIERAQLAGGARVETVEVLTVTLGIGEPCCAKAIGGGGGS